MSTPTLLAFFNLGGPEILLLIILGILLFGRKLPEVARSLGKATVEFKRGMRGLEEEISETPQPRGAIEPEPVKPPQRVTPTASKPTFDDAPAQPPTPSVPPQV
ncbi:MAG: twin-arginine translocase TatA/TatE family subunit [Thermogemmata sp.]|jgi:sec-independent protein translocase protein TatA|uniref:Sec-independent protein translocase protein TatA n=1 Tax=Thermogemmata fonticola TaxID=2755323 RepID=A0A7V8VEY7_9BACT|nr:twin-arginine translocase TatA/TatE family subunit [Thermogemmata fonticola]MBA2226799.1 twin-arginine translocase TatA/TatE family subunit [Thermogemmata fonticola]MCX8140725.1 twin-arginine translocase TatA/TatE family subunit [Gemmataceae bacterium]